MMKISWAHMHTTRYGPSSSSPEGPRWANHQAAHRSERLPFNYIRADLLIAVLLKPPSQEK